MKLFTPRRLSVALALVGGLAVGLSQVRAAESKGTPSVKPASAAEVAGLRARLDLLEERLDRQEDIEAIRRLAFSYGYYMDNGLYDQVLSLMSEKIVSCEVGGYGVFLGKAGCTRLWKGVMGGYYGGNENRIYFGKLVKHYLVKDVITVDPGGKTASARIDYIGIGGTFQRADTTNQDGSPKTGSPPGFQFGVYSMNFVKEDGIWKIGKFWLHFDTSAFLAPDWSSNPPYRCVDKKELPDLPSTSYHPFPEVNRIPFQYPNPVTDEMIPGYTDPTHYWIGNWPGEFNKDCGHH
jgi:hypothetical protein